MNNKIAKFFSRVARFYRKRTTLPNGWQETEFDNLKWRLNLSNYIDRSISIDHVFEKSTSELVKKIVKPGMNVLDIGANIGYYTLIIAKIIGANGTVWAFEPTKRYINQLEWHVKSNNFSDRVRIIKYGLSNQPGEISIKIDNVSATIHWPLETEAPNTEMIELDTLDHLVSILNIPTIDFVKMDVDGHEPFVLEGAKKFFIDNKPIILMEFSQLALDISGSDVREVHKTIKDLGYVLFSEKTQTPFKTRLEFLQECGNFIGSANAWAIPIGKVEKLSDLF